MACAPPARYILSTPNFKATQAIKGFTFPSFCGGEQTTISWQPAIMAGIPSIKKVLGNTADPPGMYNPTLSIGRISRQQATPGVVSILSSAFNWALWNL